MEDVLGYAAADDSGGMGLFVLIVVFGGAAVDPEYGLEMHGFPDRPGFDVFFSKARRTVSRAVPKASGVIRMTDQAMPITILLPMTARALSMLIIFVW